MNILSLTVATLSLVLIYPAYAQTNASPSNANTVPVLSATNAVTTAMSALVPCKTLRRAMEGQHQHIVAYGTSLTWFGSWTEILRKALSCKKALYNFTISNAGMGGVTSEWGLKNLEERVLKRTPDAVLIEFGINDSVEKFKLSLEQSRKNLETMMDRILQKNPQCDIILMTMNIASSGAAESRPQLEKYYQIYRDVAKERGLVLVDMYPTWAKMLQEEPEKFRQYVPDGLHPGPLGDAHVIVPAILKAMGL